MYLLEAVMKPLNIGEFVSMRQSGIHQSNSDHSQPRACDAADERSIPYEGMAVTDGSEESEVRVPDGAPTMREVLKRLPLILGG